MGPVVKGCVWVQSGNALSWSTDPDDSGVDVLVNVSAVGADGTRKGFMTIGRRYGGCFWAGGCDPEQGGRSGGSGGGNCTERTLDNCMGPAEPCDGRQAPDNTTCRFGHPGGNCGAGAFTMLQQVHRQTLHLLMIYR